MVQLGHFAINSVNVFLYESHGLVLALSQEVVFTAHKLLLSVIFDICNFVLHVFKLLMVVSCFCFIDQLVLAQIEATITPWIDFL